MSMNGRAGVGVIGVVALVALAAGGSSTPVRAQDTVVVREVSAWQRDVDRLRRELIAQRSAEVEFTRMLQTLETRRRLGAPDSARSTDRTQFEFVTARLQEVAANQMRIRRSLESMCSEVQKPAGWLGVATTGISMLDRPGNGPQIVRFMEPPIVESVDPGSPADRVGIRTGDVLIEMAGQPLLRHDIVFAELLRPGETIVVKLQRGARTITLSPRIEPVPEALSRTPCPWVDASTAYVLAPTAAPAVFAGTMRTQPAKAAGGGGGGVAIRVRDPNSAVPPATSGQAGSSFSVVTPMAGLFSPNTNPAGVQVVAGVQLVALNEELGKFVGVEKGLLVLEVLPGTLGGEAGFKGGDVLLDANEVELTNPLTLTRVMSRATNRTVTVTVLRANRKRETVTLKW